VLRLEFACVSPMPSPAAVDAVDAVEPSASSRTLKLPPFPPTYSRRGANEEDMECYDAYYTYEGA
jgi:hypothetical protein